jgi:hypothetical protein
MLDRDPTFDECRFVRVVVWWCAAVEVLGLFLLPVVADAARQAHPALRSARVQALLAMREYGQLPCTRGAESPPWRNLTRVHAIDCEAWVHNAKCSMDNVCPFRHPPPVARVPCRHWIRNHGECWYAEHCNFLHPGSAAQRSVHDKSQRSPGSTINGTVQSPPVPIQQPPGRASSGVAQPAQPPLSSQSTPWGSSSVIPSAASSLPSSPREIPAAAASNSRRVIGSPWTGRAATAAAKPMRPTTPEIFGRPAHHHATDMVAGGDHVLYGETQLSGSFSSVDDEIVNRSRAMTNDGIPVPPHTTPHGARRPSATESEVDALVPSSVWSHHGLRFESKQRLDFGALNLDDDVTSALRLQLGAKDSEISRLTETVLAKDQQIAFLSSQLAVFHEHRGHHHQERMHPTE